MLTVMLGYSKATAIVVVFGGRCMYYSVQKMSLELITQILKNSISYLWALK
jgi:hypothetical protein